MILSIGSDTDLQGYPAAQSREIESRKPSENEPTRAMETWFVIQSHRTSPAWQVAELNASRPFCHQRNMLITQGDKSFSGRLIPCWGTPSDAI
jgi:hypothetical protein